MPVAKEVQTTLKLLDDTVRLLSNAEETILQAGAQILLDKTILSPQRIEIANLFVQSSANVRNSITQINTALQRARQV